MDPVSCCGFSASSSIDVTIVRVRCAVPRCRDNSSSCQASLSKTQMRSVDHFAIQKRYAFAGRRRERANHSAGPGDPRGAGPEGIMHGLDLARVNAEFSGKAETRCILRFRRKARGIARVREGRVDCRQTCRCCRYRDVLACGREKRVKAAGVSCFDTQIGGEIFAGHYQRAKPVTDVPIVECPKRGGSFCHERKDRNPSDGAVCRRFERGKLIGQPRNIGGTAALREHHQVRAHHCRGREVVQVPRRVDSVHTNSDRLAPFAPKNFACRFARGVLRGRCHRVLKV